MPTVIMPKMGDAMDEGVLLRWLKAEGEEVAAGEPIAEIETDKVTLEIEAEAGGTLTQRLANEGDSIPVGDPIATIGAADEAPAAKAAPAAPAVPAEEGAPAKGEAPTAEAAPNAAALPEERHADADGAAIDSLRQAQEDAGGGSGATNGRAAAGAPPTGRAPGERLRASPLVKRLAAEHGIDLAGVPGTGPGGRIVKDDIMPFVTGAAKAPAPAAPAEPVAAAPAAAPAQEAPARAPAPAPSPAAPPAAPVGRPAGVPRDLSRIRRTTGRRMTESKTQIPHFYVSVEVDMGPAVAFRTEVNAQVTDDAAKLSYNDLVLKAAALALREYPNLNASWENDTAVDHPNIDVNMAIAIEGGLIAPFVADADQKSLGAIARASKDLAARARSGGLKPEEYQGGTFTVSNLGMFAVEEFVAVINPPQAAILAVGSIKDLAVVNDGALVPGQRMKLTLSADHRITDGAEVARFLGVVRRYLENPMLLALA